MRKTLIPFTIILAFSLIMTACATTTPTAAPTPTQNADQVGTMVAQTVDAIEAQKAAQATSTATMPPLVPTLPGNPTQASVLVPTLAGAVVATTKPCNQAMLVSETIPDGTSFVNNAPFTKAWTIQNIGTCTWNASYKLAYVSGDSMSGPKSVDFGSVVAPGQNITLSIPLYSNSTVSTTTGYWGLYDDKGIYWGRVWVTINSGTSGTPIGNPTSFTITGVSTTETTSSGVCTFHAAVTASTAGTMTFYWVVTHNPGTGAVVENLGNNSVDFASAGTISVGYRAPIGTTQVYLFVVSPNNQAFAPGAYSSGCTS